MTRLFISQSLTQEYVDVLDSMDINYLSRVMRKKIGDEILIFNQKDGEYKAAISEISNKKITLKILDQTRKPEAEKIVRLIFAPIKQPRINFLLEKATELGATHLIPIQTKHSVIDKVNLDKWNIYVKEASEQCERLSVPIINPLSKIDHFLATWPEEQNIILCNEKEKKQFITDHLKNIIQKEYNIMIGPEGGFSQDELKLLLSKKFITSVHLGSRILRAETATLSALTLCQFK